MWRSLQVPTKKTSAGASRKGRPTRRVAHGPSNHAFTNKNLPLQTNLYQNHPLANEKVVTLWGRSSERQAGRGPAAPHTVSHKTAGLADRLAARRAAPRETRPSSAKSNPRELPHRSRRKIQNRIRRRCPALPRAARSQAAGARARRPTHTPADRCPGPRTLDGPRLPAWIGRAGLAASRSRPEA